MIVLIGKPFDNYRTSNDIYNYLTNDKVKRVGVLNIDIRYINDTDEQNKWDNRKQKIIDIILQSDADIIFFPRNDSKIILKELIFLFNSLNNANPAVL